MKLSVELAKELHARYQADRAQTLATLSVEVGVTPSGLRKRWLRLGLPLDLAQDRGGNLATRERAAVLRADLEAAFRTGGGSGRQDAPEVAQE